MAEWIGTALIFCRKVYQFPLTPFSMSTQGTREKSVSEKSVSVPTYPFFYVNSGYSWMLAVEKGVSGN